MLRAILFDFNGVLVDDEPIHMEILQQILEDEDLSLSREDYYQNYVGIDDRGCFEKALHGSDRDGDASVVARLVARKASYYQQRMQKDGYPFFGGAVELVEAAAGEGLTLGVVSGALRQEIEDALGQAGIRGHFKTVVSVEDVRHGKPDPESYLQAVNELNSRAPLPERLFHPHEILAIEDTRTGLEAATGAGLVTLGVAQTLSRDALGMADFRIDDLAGLSIARLQNWYAEASRS